MAPSANPRSGRRPQPRPTLVLSPPRDTGLTLGRRSRRSRRSRSVVSWPVLVVTAVGIVLVAGGLYSAAAHPARPTKALSARVAAPSIAATIGKMVRPTPRLAQYDGLQLRLPVPADAVTAVAFHQATYKNALPMTILVPCMDVATARRLGRARKAAIASGTVVPPLPVTGDIWGGSAVRLYRSGRSGDPCTAADVGAPPGSAVLAPVDGTVVLVRPYKLYNKFDDYEIHIIPEGRWDVDVVLLHITDVGVAVGDRVKAGVSRVASVRRLSTLTALQLRTYSGDGGDHTHLQLNRTPSPGSIWVSAPSGPVATRFSLPSTASSTPAVTR